jgi:hypothetical protein
MAGNPPPDLQIPQTPGSPFIEIPRHSIPSGLSQEVATTLEYLTSLAVAIRMSGTRHRDLRAEEFAKNDRRVASLREETLELLKSIRLSGLFRRAKDDAPDLTDTVEISEFLRDRLTECNAKRRSRFLYASHHDRTLGGKPASVAERRPSTKKARDTSGMKREPTQPAVPAHIAEAARQEMDRTQPTRTSPSLASSAPTPIDRAAWNSQHEPSPSPKIAGSFVAAKLKMKYPPLPKVDLQAVNFQCPCCRLPVAIMCAEKNAWRSVTSSIMPTCRK